MRYRSNMRQRGGRGRGGSPLSFLMPFIILICIGIIGVLVFKLWTALTDIEPERGVTFYAVEGSAQMKAWGTDQFVDIPSGSFLMEGDELMTSDSAKIVMEFSDGTIMRVEGGTDFILEEMELDEDIPEVKLMLVHGQIWLNKNYKGTGKTNIIVQMGDTVFKSDGASIIDLENKLYEVVRVLNGDSVEVDVLSKDGEKTVDTVIIGVGQEVEFSDEVLDKYWQFQSPSVLQALSDTFRSSKWYKWNVEEDLKPSNFSGTEDLDFSIVDEVITSATGEEVVEEEEELLDFEDVLDEDIEDEDVVEEEEEEEEEEEPVISGTVSTPTIASVGGVSETNEMGYYVVKSNPATLSGSVSGAKEIWVNDYKLTQFRSGDSTWKYHANADYNLMQEGENTYKVHAVDSNGNKSEILTVKVFYKAPAAPAPVVEEEEVVVEEEVEEEPSEPEVDPNAPPDWLT